MTKEQIETFLATPEADAVLTLVAYAIKKTPTEKDDEILDDISGYGELIAEKIKAIADKEPSDKDAKQAGLIILEKIASLTKTKWDDLIVSLAKKIM